MAVPAVQSGENFPKLWLVDTVPSDILYSLHHHWSEYHLWYHCGHILRTSRFKGEKHTCIHL